MDVTIDGIIYQLQSRGGISRLYSELLPRMCHLDPTLQFEVLTSGASVQPLPQHAQITPRVLAAAKSSPRLGRAASWWNGLRRQQAIGTGTGKLWHSTYYTRPRFWKGRQVVTVLDMVHELYPELFPEPAEEAFRMLKRRCVLEADLVISISEVTRQDVHRLYGVDLKKIVSVPLAHSDVFTLAPSKPPDSLPMTKPFFLYVGRRSHNKNFAALAAAYAVWPRRTDVDLLVAGENWSLDEKTYLAALDAASGLRLVGPVTDAELVCLYQHAAAYIYPSLYEGFGIPLLEAMACGCPVIASRIPSTVEVAGDFPIYFDLDTPESFVDALDIALTEGRGTPRCVAAELHTRQFSWDATAAQTLSVYHQLMG